MSGGSNGRSRHLRNSELRSSNGAFVTAASAYLCPMSLRCLMRLHRPMLNSIIRREDRYTALCESCGLPIERSEEGSWTETEPLLSRRGQAA
jgi:hypothetical protein